MSFDFEYTFHLFEVREFRERFLPAIQGEEPIVRELLDAADASGPSWTALHKMFDETRVTWQQAVDAEDGEAAQRTVFASFARLVSHLRPAFTVRGFGLSLIDPERFPNLIARVKSPGVLLVDDKGNPLPGIPYGLPGRVPSRCLPGRSSGGVIMREDVRPFLDAFREEMPRIASWAQDMGLPAEPGITMLLGALVEAKLKNCSLFEASDALMGDTHLSKSHRLTFEKPKKLAPAVLREVGKLFGREVTPKKKKEPPPAPIPVEIVAYTPQGTFKVGQRLQHSTFGTGEVIDILDSRRFKARFSEEEKILVQGLAPRNNDNHPTLDGDGTEPGSEPGSEPG